MIYYIVFKDKIHLFNANSFFYIIIFLIKYFPLILFTHCSEANGIGTPPLFTLSKIYQRTVSSKQLITPIMVIFTIIFISYEKT